MRLYIKVNQRQRINFPIPVPIFIFRFALSGFIKDKIMAHCDENTRRYLMQLDFEALYNSLTDLKNYKGLRLVEVSQKNGTEILIIV